jgi:uncharacterized protein YndB with AHSA1/START domain
MFTQNHEITIKTNVQNVWKAMTDCETLSKYLGDMKVKSNWQQGSEIVYTHYDADGSVTIWKGMEMIWKGIIESFEPNKQFRVRYLDANTGLVSETYTLQELDANTTQVNFEQIALSAEIAENHKEGNEYTLNAMKKFLEK